MMNTKEIEITGLGNESRHFVAAGKTSADYIADVVSQVKRALQGATKIRFDVTHTFELEDAVRQHLLLTVEGFASVEGEVPLGYVKK